MPELWTECSASGSPLNDLPVDIFRLLLFSCWSQASKICCARAARSTIPPSSFKLEGGFSRQPPSPCALLGECPLYKDRKTVSPRGVYHSYL